METPISWVSPFENNVDLISISSGASIAKDVAGEKREALTRGEQTSVTFTAEKLGSDWFKKKYHATKKKFQIKTFETAT